MTYGIQTQTGALRNEHYQDLVDLYSARAVRARTITVRDAKITPVVAIGRGARTTAISQRSASFSSFSLKWRLATAASIVLIGLSVATGTPLG